MKSAGLRNPLVERRAVIKENPLLNSLKKYLQRDFKGTDVEDDYLWSTKSLKGLENLLVADAHAAVIALQGDNNVRHAGSWLSAAYNCSSDKLVVYELQLPEDKIPCGLGFRLNKDKVLVNSGNAGNYMGNYASGVVINNGNAGNLMGEYASGVVINNGNAGNLMGEYASGVVINNGDAGFEMGWNVSGVVINNGNVEDWIGEGASGTIICLKDPKGYSRNLSKARLVLDEQQCAQNPALSAYLTELKNLTLKLKTEYTNPNLIKEVLRRCNRSAIETKITEILVKKKGGSD
jgi:hypothetical protein